MKKIRLRSLVLMVVIAFAIIFAIFIYKNIEDKKLISKPITPTIDTIVSPALVTNEWKTYANKSLGVEFKYPPQFVIDIDNTEDSIHLVNKLECKHNVAALIRNKLFCYNITVSISTTTVPHNSYIMETVGIDKIPSATYERWSSGGTFNHSNIIVKADTDKWYVFGYFYNNKDQTEIGTLQDVKDNYYTILSTVSFK